MVPATIFETLSAFLQAHPEPICFVLLVFCGVGLPIPEEPILLGAGMSLVRRVAEHPRLLPEVAMLRMTLVCASGILLGDLFCFYLGRNVGRRIFTLRFVAQIATRPRRVRAERFFQRYGHWAIFLAGFLAGVRLVTFFSAGMSRRVSYLRFAVMDALRCFVSVPVSIFLGYKVWKEFEDLARAKKELGLFHKVLLASLAVGVFLWWLLSRKRRDADSRRRARSEAARAERGPQA